jgi:hypothetical protein
MIAVQMMSAIDTANWTTTSAILRRPAPTVSAPL